MVVSIRIAVLLVMTPCSLMGRYQHFRGTYYLPPPNPTQPNPKRRQHIPSKRLSSTSALKMVTVSSLEIFMLRVQMAHSPNPD
jgi:hypothetical protein